MSKYTESEKKILQAMVQAFEKASSDCAYTANQNPSPTSEAFWADSIMLRSLADHLAHEKDCE